MKLALTIDYEVDDSDPETEALLEEAVGEEARVFVENVRRRLAAEGVENISIELNESGG